MKKSLQVAAFLVFPLLFAACADVNPFRLDGGPDTYICNDHGGSCGCNDNRKLCCDGTELEVGSCYYPDARENRRGSGRRY